MDYGTTSYTERCGGDGNQTCCLTTYSAPMKSRMLAEGGLLESRDTSSPLLTADIMPGDYPYFSEPTTRVVWLACASSAYLQTNRTTLPPLWSSGFVAPEAHAFVIEDLTFLNGPPGLPAALRMVMSDRGIDALRDSVYISTSIDDKALTKAKREVRAHVKKGLGFEARYEVFEHTNVHGVTIPLLFTFSKVDSWKGNEIARTLTEGQTICVWGGLAPCSRVVSPHSRLVCKILDPLIPPHKHLTCSQQDPRKW
jgi:hypothetical protein